MNQIKNNNKKTTSVKKSIEKYRNKLLDTGRRNNLISFKHSEHSRQHIRVIDELPNFLYNTFKDGKTLTFRALPEDDKIPSDEKTANFRSHLEQAKLTDEEYDKAINDENADSEQIERDLRNKIREQLKMPSWKGQKNLSPSEIAIKHNLNPSYEMPLPARDEEDNKKHSDKFIQTLLKPEEMSRKLSGLHSYIRSDIQETGVNTLYAAFGFLEWRESDSSAKSFFAPLVLLQLKINKKPSKGGYSYTIQATGEEAEINLPIFKKLNEFGIELPKLNENDTPDSYMEEVNNIIEAARKRKWRIRRFITIGRFRFARLVMYHDLDEKKWSGNYNLINTIIQNLFSGAKPHSENYHAEDYNIDTPAVEKIVPLLVTPADASQHSALVDVMKGKNLAIKGPPGTGKSQTITNIIANALTKKKTVLFLAEKMAALNVVHKRLSDAKLGPYCLELHSTKAKKTEIIQSISKRLDLKPEEEYENLTSKLEEFKDNREKITKYLDLLNSKFGRQNKTIHDYLWTFLWYKDRMGDLARKQKQLTFDQANITEKELQTHIDKLDTIATLKKKVEIESNKGDHPWSFVGNFSLNPIEQSEMKQKIRDWKELLEEMQTQLKNLSKRFTMTISPSNSAVKTFLKNTEILANIKRHDLDQDIIEKLNSMERVNGFLGFIKNIHSYLSIKEEIHGLVELPKAITQTNEIKKQATIAKQLATYTLLASEIKTKSNELEEEITNWKIGVKTLLKIGHFDQSKKENLGEIAALSELPYFITSLPENYLLFRTKDFLDNKNTRQLKNALDIQRDIGKLVHEHKNNFDFSIMGKALEIRLHAAVLDKAGIFAFLYSPSYRQAKKIYVLAAKHKTWFRAKQASKTLREIALIKEERHKIEDNVELQKICGSSFSGLDTDFEKFYAVNEWAGNVRKRYSERDPFTFEIQQWLLTAEKEQLDSLRPLANDQKLIELRTKIMRIKNTVSPDTPVKKYLSSLDEKVKKLNDIRQLLKNIKASKATSLEKIIKYLPQLQKAKEAKSAVENNQDMPSLLGNRYKGVHTNTRNMQKTTDFISKCLEQSEIKDSLHVFLEKDFGKKWDDFINSRTNIEKRLEKHNKLTEQIQKQAKFSSQLLHSSNTYTKLIKLFTNALNKAESLSDWVELNASIKESRRDIKGDLLATYIEEKLDFKTLPKAFKYMIYEAIADKIYKRHPMLSSIKGMDLDKARARIKKLDKEIIELQQTKLCSNLNKNTLLPGDQSGSIKTWTEGALIKKEIHKTKLPFRELMNRAGRSVQLIKPCFLMSPLTVAQYLEPGQFNFDLVVIDEASQMRTEDALGAAARAKQIVVVGDRKQLSPTSFFDNRSKDDEEDEEDIGDIMDMALTHFRLSRQLNRHYRSQHESLINFSNHQFYDGRLVLFPSPIKNPDELGVQYEYIKGTYTQQTNMKEVEAVVKKAISFMQRYPERSLGIATINIKQKELIESEMDRAFAEHSHAAEYREKWEETLEPFFIKNLENVQGDERDAIFISTVYGPDKNGTVMQRFGPINNKIAGHRRLNVLFSRAKKNMVVITSLQPEDIKVNKDSKDISEGLKAFKGFLSYAKEGRISDEGKPTNREPDSDFEVYVKDKLESIGCEVHPQVGVAGYRIDLGVKHPKYPNGYLLGVECDGATYHSSKSARERDVQRQQVLENLGWNIYRIWSTDWFSNSTQEFKKLKNHMEKLINKPGKL